MCPGPWSQWGPPGLKIILINDLAKVMYYFYSPMYYNIVITITVNVIVERVANGNVVVFF